MTAYIPNPATRGGRQPISIITDRAKRYRAQADIEQRDKRCIYCGAPGRGRRLDVEHINGTEDDGSPANLAYSCRPCNTTKGSWFAQLGIGKKTRQRNPRGRLRYSPGVNARPITTMGQWVLHLDIVRGNTGADAATVRKAADRIRATPPDERSSFAREIWRQRDAHGTTRPVPF